MPSDGVVNGLKAHYIIYLGASMGDMMRGIAYNIQPWAMDCLEKHPELLAAADDAEVRQLAERAEAVRQGGW